MRSAIRSLWAEPRPAPPPRRVWRDWLLVALLLTSAVLEIALREDAAWGPLTVGFLLVLAIALLWRRTFPLATVAVVFAGMSSMSITMLLGAEPLLPYSLGWALVLPYALFRWGAGREAGIGLAIMLLTGLLGIVADFTGVGDAVGGLVVLSAPAALGASIRYRVNARHREIDQAKLLEREQLARELHDTVAHHVSAIAIQAQAGRTLSATHPERALHALEIIEEAASQTLEEMRTMVGALRAGDEPDLAPQPGVSDLERLTRGNGDRPRIEVAISGDLEGLSPTIDAAIYRLAQESITNAVRHARNATRIEIRVVGGDDHVRLTVRDDGDARPTDRGSWGYGLVGMTERATLLGGTLEAGPGPDGGWTVRAALPRAGAVA